MTRRRWFAIVFATLFGAWGAARARSVPPPPTRAEVPPVRWRGLATPGGTTVSCHYYDAANRLFAIRDEPGMVTTCVYDCSGLASTGG
jgi:hypothetical protein